MECGESAGLAKLLRNDVRRKHAVARRTWLQVVFGNVSVASAAGRELRLEPLQLGARRSEGKGKVLEPGAPSAD
jgi:hypothetical protein